MTSKKSINIRFDNPTIKEIVEMYSLNDSIGSTYFETENIAALIKQIYLYAGLYNSTEIENLNKKIISREVIITVYSVVEATQASIAKKIQKLCKTCKKRCHLYNTELLTIRTDRRSEESFNFLRKAKIINFTKKEFDTYYFIKNLRNNVHLVEMGEPISDYKFYKQEYLNLSIEFMGLVLKKYKSNLQEHFKNIGCFRRQ